MNITDATHDALIAAAVGAGVVREADRDAWRTRLGTAPTPTTTALAQGLAKGVTMLPPGPARNPAIAARKAELRSQGQGAPQRVAASARRPASRPKAATAAKPKAAVPPKPKPAGPDTAERDRTIDAAIRAGKFLEKSRAAYAALWDQDPEGAKRSIEALTAVPLLAAEPEEPPSLLTHKPFSLAGNVDEGVAAREAAEAAASAAPVPSGPAKVEADEMGYLTYRGFPVATSSAGEPCVFAGDDWMKVSAFEASALTEDALREGLFSASMFPDGPTGRRYRQGPS